MFFSRQKPWQEEIPQLQRLFVYGTLGFPEILSAAIGRKIESKDYLPATLHGFKRLAVKDARFPVIRKCEAAWVEGFTLSPITTEEFLKLDDWEGGLYERIKVNVGTEAGEKLVAWVYADVHHKAPISDSDWCPEIFLNTSSNS